MARRPIDVAVIIPDASPVLTLTRIGRLHLLGSFAVPVRIMDQVHYEIIEPENDPKGEVAAGLQRLHNQIEIIETNVGVGAPHRAKLRPAGVVRRSRRDGIARRPPQGCPSAQHDGLAADLAPGGIAAGGPRSGGADQRCAQDADGAVREGRLDEARALDLVTTEFWT